MRRDILFDDLSEAIAECERLAKSGYKRNGNWTLGQICRHIRLTIDANVDGYPRWMMIMGTPLRPILSRLVLPRLLRGDSPSGIKTSSMFVPPESVEDETEIAALRDCIARYMTNRDALHPHPGFGRMTPDTFDRFHAAHASHHLSFLEPAANNAIE